jgi:hypothetical protein
VEGGNMRKKVLLLLVVPFLMFIFYSCSSNPEEDLLKRYFHAVSLSDVDTMSSMSMDPLNLEVENWEIVSVSEEVKEAATLPDLNAAELALKKQLEDHVGITLDASDDLDDAKFEMENARTRSARIAASRSVDRLQKEYDEIYTEHKEIQKQYNEAKEASQIEEDIAKFSLFAGDLPGLRDFAGDVFFKEVEIKCDLPDGTEKSYNIFMRRYVLEDTIAGITRRGRWIIVDFEPLT